MNPFVCSVRGRPTEGNDCDNCWPVWAKTPYGGRRRTRRASRRRRRPGTTRDRNPCIRRAYGLQTILYEEPMKGSKRREFRDRHPKRPERPLPRNCTRIWAKLRSVAVKWETFAPFLAVSSVPTVLLWPRLPGVVCVSCGKCLLLSCGLHFAA
ncbi:unnamed protein product, partial [Oppiella nova]